MEAIAIRNGFLVKKCSDNAEKINQRSFLK